MKIQLNLKYFLLSIIFNIDKKNIFIKREREREKVKIIIMATVIQ